MLRSTVTLCGWLLTVETWAQVSGTVTVVSDYRYRGVSLSDGRPAAQLSVAYDHTSGWYAGAFASTVQRVAQSSGTLQVLSYIGYAHRMSSELTWDLGASYSAYPGAWEYSYPEVHFGVVSERVGARIYYAPDYFGQGFSTLYAEVNGARPLQDRLHLIGHLGVLRRNGRNPATENSSHDRFDVRAGIGIDLDKVNIEFIWVATEAGNALYPTTANRHQNGAVLSLSRSF